MIFLAFGFLCMYSRLKYYWCPQITKYIFVVLSMCAFSNIAIVILDFSLLLLRKLSLLIFFGHFLYNFFASFLLLFFLYNYQSFSLLKAIAISFPFRFAISIKSKNERQLYEEQKVKEAINHSKIFLQRMKQRDQEIKSDNTKLEEQTIVILGEKISEPKILSYLRALKIFSLTI